MDELNDIRTDDTRNGIKWRELMTLSTAAKYAGLSRRHFHRAWEDEFLEFHQIGRTLFVKGSDLTKFVESRAIAPRDGRGNVLAYLERKKRKPYDRVVMNERTYEALVGARG